MVLCVVPLNSQNDKLGFGVLTKNCRMNKTSYSVLELFNSLSHFVLELLHKNLFDCIRLKGLGLFP